ncbi:MAG: chorismate synthase [Clostridia bacterium]|nr:chorismate synthase [Clostridia bacterium]
MPNYKGQNLQIELNGSSHSDSMTIKLKGVESGQKIDFDFIRDKVNRRCAKFYEKDLVTGRMEPDKFNILSGIENETTTGDEIVLQFENVNHNKSEYSKNADLLRPSHSDLVSFLKYGKIESGGGCFSGRMTAPINAIGAICENILDNKNIKIRSNIIQIGAIKGTEFNKEMKDEIKKAKQLNDSVGGIVECKISGLPVCLGNPVFQSIESRISDLIFSIPGIKGIEFGKGFDSIDLYASEYNDEIYIKNGKIRTKSNNDGGINGGLSNGEDVYFRVVFKPTPSISKEQNTVNIKTQKNAKIKISGRHDPCIAVRGAVVVETVCAIAIYDLLLG